MTVGLTASGTEVLTAATKLLPLLPPASAVPVPLGHKLQKAVCPAGPITPGQAQAQGQSNCSKNTSRMNRRFFF